MYTLTNHGPVRLFSTVKVNRRMQRLADILGVMGDKTRIYQAFQLYHRVVRRFAVLGESHRQTLGPLRYGIRRRTDPLRI